MDKISRLILPRCKRILAVDDEGDYLEGIPGQTAGLLGRLRREGYDATGERWGQNVLRKVKEWNPDLITLDVFLTKTHGDGEVIYQEIRDAGICDVPVLMLTGKMSPAVARISDDIINRKFYILKDDEDLVILKIEAILGTTGLKLK
jgi:CheY-like chemotaxis protein